MPPFRQGLSARQRSVSSQPEQSSKRVNPSRQVKLHSGSEGEQYYSGQDKGMQDQHWVKDLKVKFRTACRAILVHGWCYE